MGKYCLENYFVAELCSAGGFPLEEKSELGFLSIKVSFFGVIVVYILLFLLLFIIVIMFFFHNISSTLHMVLLYNINHLKHPIKLQMHWLGPFLAININNSRAIQLAQIDGVLQ
jgi:hypothetical protein